MGDRRRRRRRARRRRRRRRERRRPPDSSGPHLLTLPGELVHAGITRAERAALNGAAGMPGAAGGAGMPGARLRELPQGAFIQMELCEARMPATTCRRATGVAAAPAERRLRRTARESPHLWHQITAGLHHVHVCGLVHRDLKPANCCFQGSYIKPAFGPRDTTAALRAKPDGGGRRPRRRRRYPRPRAAAPAARRRRHARYAAGAVAAGGYSRRRALSRLIGSSCSIRLAPR